MFNRADFNRQSYNRSSSGIDQTGAALIVITAVAAAGLQHNQKGQATISLAAKAIPVLITQAQAASVIAITGYAAVIRARYCETVTAEILINAKVFYYAYGTAMVNLGGLTIPPGGELIIDTDKMTVTLDGISVIEYVSMDSDFIQILAGLNTIVYQDSSGAVRQASVRVEWKPRWL